MRMITHIYELSVYYRTSSKSVGAVGLLDAHPGAGRDAAALLAALSAGPDDRHGPRGVDGAGAIEEISLVYKILIIYIYI